MPQKYNPIQILASVLWYVSYCEVVVCPVHRPASSERMRVGSPSHTPPAATTSPSPTPPATPARRGEFTQGEYARRHQLRIMEDLDKVLRQKTANQAKKTHSRPRSMTREGSQLSQSPAKGKRGKVNNNVSASACSLSFPLVFLLLIAFVCLHSPLTVPRLCHHVRLCFSGAKLTKVHSHSSLNLAATANESANSGGDLTKKPPRYAAARPYKKTFSTASL